MFQIFLKKFGLSTILFDPCCLFKKVLIIFLTEELIWFDLIQPFSLLEELKLENKLAVLPFDQKKSFDQRTIQFDPYCLLQSFWWFSRKLSFDFICVFYQILLKKQYGLTSAVVSLKRMLNILILKLNFNIAYHSATCLFLISFIDTDAWNFRKKRCGRNRITWLDSFLKFYLVN